jgi:glycosyltransferase involved in cell wall biosynthesis
MRILHVIASLAPRYGGPSQACLELCQELARRGHQVAIYTTNVDGDGNMDVPLEMPVFIGGVELRYFSVQRPRYYKFSLPLFYALKRTIPTFDIVHIHSLYLFPSTIAAHLCRKFDVPYLVKPHGTLNPYLFRRHRLRKRLYEALFERRNLERAAAVQFTATDEMRLAGVSNAFRVGVREGHEVVVPNGVVISEAFRWPAAASEVADRSEVPRPQQRTLLFLSRINHNKGLDILARAFGIVARQRLEVRLVIAGPDNEGYGARVRELLAAEGVLDRTVFTGMLLGDEKAAAFRAADVFVLPSYSENFGIAIVEAMAYRLPVVISNRVNIWREIEDAGAGIVTDCDPQEVSIAILRLLDDPVGRNAMGRRGQLLAKRRFSWETVGGEMLALYHEVLRRSKASVWPSRLAS